MWSVSQLLWVPLQFAHTVCSNQIATEAEMGYSAHYLFHFCFTDFTRSAGFPQRKTPKIDKQSFSFIINYNNNLLLLMHCVNPLISVGPLLYVPHPKWPQHWVDRDQVQLWWKDDSIINQRRHYSLDWRISGDTATYIQG